MNPLTRLTRKTFVLSMCLLLASACSPSATVQSRTLPPPPPPRSRDDSSKIQTQKARELFKYAWKENERLEWDDCIARKASLRAKTMVKAGYFSHKDPQNGRNPAWRLVASCLSCRYAGENLSRGDLPAEMIHEAFMKSPKHRKNITDPRFTLMGVGCYGTICVELFAGY